MADYKFKTGQSVEMQPNQRMGQKGGSYQIVRPLPADQSGNQYRVKSKSDGHERVAYEVDLHALSSTGLPRP
jgi:hypothetical protein